MDNYKLELDHIIARALKRLDNGERPTISHVEVSHDPWCDFLNGKGECNCDPELREFIVKR